MSDRCPAGNRTPRRLVLALLAPGLGLACGDAERSSEAAGDAPSLALSAPAHAPDLSFGALLGLREVAPGTVLLADGLGRALIRLHVATGAADTLGSEGSGPGEYRQPGDVFAFRGDSSLLADFGTGRLLVVGPDGTLGRAISMVQEGDDGQPLLLLPRAADARGRLYVQPVYRGSLGEVRPDSAPLLRWDPDAGRVDTLARLLIEERREFSGRLPGMRRGAVVPVWASPVDAWTLTADDRVAIARAVPYRLEILDDGARTRGPEIAADAPRLEEPDMLAWMIREERTAVHVGAHDHAGVNGLSIELPGPGGHGERDPAMVEWAERLPPFYPRGASAAPDGTVWVERTSKVGEPLHFDVFDRDGRRTAQVRGPTGRRVAGFGHALLYLVRTDALDREYIEAYPYPIGLGG